MRWAIIALEGAIWRDFGLAEMAVPCAILLTIAVVTFVIGAKRQEAGVTHLPRSWSHTMTIADKGYAHPEALVSTEWVAEHLDDPNVRLVESNEDPLVYPSGHIPGAVQIDWTNDLNDPLRRDYIAAADFAALVSRFGITPDTTVVLYGDRNNWWACYAFWVFQLFGHTNARILDGGRLKWEKEGRPLTREVPTYAASTYPVPSSRQDDGASRLP